MVGLAESRKELGIHSPCCHHYSVDQPTEHSLKRFIHRVTKSVLQMLFIVVVGILFPDSYLRHHVLSYVLIALIVGLVFGTLRYLETLEAARNEREPNVL